MISKFNKVKLLQEAKAAEKGGTAGDSSQINITVK